MSGEEFLLTQRITEIEQQFVDKGWVTIYQGVGGTEKDLIFCCLVKDKYAGKYMKDRNWGIEPGREGRPAVYGSLENNKETYKSYDKKDGEPFLFYRHFSHIDQAYVDVSEEFVLYWKLYEEAKGKQERIYTYYDDYGESDEVIIVTEKQVRIKYKYLLEYISVRKMHFAIVFDFERWKIGNLEDFGVTPMEKDIKRPNAFYHHTLRYFSDGSGHTIENWIRGKAIIKYEKGMMSHHGILGPETYEKFIIGIDKFGKEIMNEPTDDAAYMLTLTCFKREVLDKYYNDPVKYQLDGFSLSLPAYTLKLDNNHKDHVAVFLKELSILPHKEQLHWKQYNIVPPEKGVLSEPFFNVMIKGSWARQVGRADNYFKDMYRLFNKRWEEKFGWPFYLPLKGTDVHYLTSLHLPSTDNIKTFREQLIGLVKLTIDSLNEAKLSENIQLVKEDRGIHKLEKFLKYHQKPIPELIQFLKHLQNLRSGLAVHRVSDDNKRADAALAYFNITGENYIDGAENIFIKSVHVINTLQKYFLGENQEDDDL